MSENQNLYIIPVENMLESLERLSVLRPLVETPPIMKMMDLLTDLVSDAPEPAEVAYKYHDWASSILAGEAPRVTGDRWRDFLLGTVLESENLFSDMAAACGADPKRTADEMIVRAMQRDIKTIQSLFLVDDGRVRMWCRVATRGDTHDWARWTYGTIEQVEKESESRTEPIWHMRRLFLKTEDWGDLVDFLFDFHKLRGSGAMVESGFLAWNGSFLRPIQPPRSVVPGEVLGALKQQRTAIYTVFERLLSDRRTDELLLYGPRGMGKWSLLYNVLADFPIVRTVFLESQSPADMRSLLTRLSTQPGYFAVCVDVARASQLEDVFPLLDAARRAKPRNAALIFLLHTPLSSNMDSREWPGAAVAFPPVAFESFPELAQSALTALDVPADTQLAPKWAEENGTTTLSALRFAERMADIVR